MADNVESIYDLDVTSFIAALDKADARLGISEEKIKKLGSLNPFKEASKSALTFEKEMSDGARQMVATEQASAELRNELKRIADEMTKVNKKKSEFVAAEKYKSVTSELTKVKSELKNIEKQLDKVNVKGKETNGMFSRLKGSLLGALSGITGGGGSGVTTLSTVLGGINPVLGVMSGLLGGVASKALSAQAGWQGLEAALTVALGSAELTNNNLEVLEGLALRLPTGLNELTSAFNALVNRGFKPAKDEIANLSGFAASQNKTFDQLIQAILDAEEGELERLKEFGIQASVQGDKVSVTFKGITKTFEKGARDSAKAFSDLAKELGLDKLNDAKMKTLEGRMSNLGDQADRITRLIGKALIPVFEALFTITERILGVVDRAITSWNLFDDTLNKVGDDTNKVTYPALSRLFELFGDSGKANDVENFVLNFRIGFEKVKNVISQAVAELEYFGKLNASVLNLVNAGNGYGIKEFKKDRADAQKQVELDRKQFVKNLELLKKAEYDVKVQGLMNRKISGGSTELKYGPDGKLTQKPVSPSDKKKAEDLEGKYKQDLLKLEQQYGKEKLETLAKNELEYIAAKAEFAKKELDLEKAGYQARKKAAFGKNTTLSDSENKMFDARSGFIDDLALRETEEYYKDKAKLTNDNEKSINSILSNEYQQRVQQTENMYNELIAEAKKNGVSQARIEQLNQKKITEQKKIYAEQELAEMKKSATVEEYKLETKILEAQIKHRTDLVLEATRKLLNARKKAAKAQLEWQKSQGDQGDKEEMARLENQIASLNLQLQELEETANRMKGMKGLITKALEGLFGKGTEEWDPGRGAEALLAVADEIGKSVSDLYSTLNQLSQNRINQIDAEIQKKKEQVETENELNSEGSANNLALRKHELEELQKQREAALKQQQRLQKQQLIMDSTSQVSSMITATAKVYAALSGAGPFGVAIATAAVALMFGAFAAAKVKSFQLINAQNKQEYRDGGMIHGPSHENGGVDVTHEVEGGEYVTNRRSTAKYLDLIEAINSDNEAGILDYLVREMISGTDISMPEADRKDQLRFIREYNNTVNSKDDDVLKELQSLKAELVEIKKSNSRIPKSQLVNVGNGQYAEISENSTVIRRLPEY